MRPASPAHWNGRHFAQDRDARRHLVAKAGHEVHQAPLKEAGHEIHNAAGEVSEEFNHAIDEVRGVVPRRRRCTSRG